MILHLRKGKAILRVAIAFNNKRNDLSLFLELAGQLIFELFGVSLPE